MADFCKECSQELFGPEVTLFTESIPLKSGEGFQVLCESCGPILVNHQGERIPNEFQTHRKNQKTSCT